MMTDIMNGAVARKAWGDGESLLIDNIDLLTQSWVELTPETPLSVFSNPNLRFKVKPPFIINGVKTPHPFTPKKGESFFTIHPLSRTGWTKVVYDGGYYLQYGAWRTQEEIEEVVKAYHSPFVQK